MPWRDNDNYGYRDGDQKPDFRSGFDGKSERQEADDAGKYAGFSAKFPSPFRLFDSAKISFGTIISGTDSATRVCGELSRGKEESAEAAKELSEVKQFLSKIVDILDKIKFEPTNEKPIDSLSIEGKLIGEVNLLPAARSLEGNLKISTSDGVSKNLKADQTIGDKISVGGRVSVEGCMTVKNRDRYQWDLINKW